MQNAECQSKCKMQNAKCKIRNEVAEWNENKPSPMPSLVREGGPPAAVDE